MPISLPSNTLHFLLMRNPRILRKRLRPNTTIQLLLRLQPIQHILIVNGPRADHPDMRLGFRTNPHESAAFRASVRLHRVAGVGGASECRICAGELLELGTREVSAVCRLCLEVNSGEEILWDGLTALSMTTMKVLPLWPLVLRHQVQWHIPCVECWLGIAGVRFEEGMCTYCEKRRAFELVGPVATRTAAFDHVVGMCAL